MDIKKWQLLLKEGIKLINEVDYALSGEKLIATNKSEFSWEYDQLQKNAFLYCNEKNRKLRLIIEKVKIKSGLGKGHWTAIELEVLVGTVEKPNLGKIKNILKDKGLERSRSSYPFSAKWTDKENGEEIKLGEIIKKYGLPKGIK